MDRSWETLLKEEDSRAASLSRIRSTVLEEANHSAPPRSWRWTAVALALAPLLMVAAVVLVLGASGQLNPSSGDWTVALFLLVGVGTAISAFGAVAPRGRWLPWAGVALSGVGAAALVVARGEGSPSALPEWTCTAGHLGAALVPLTVAIWAQRQAAFRPLRALSAGLAVGTTGALVGVVGCAQGWQHVLGYHLSAWALVAVLTVLIARQVRPKSFAP